MKVIAGIGNPEERFKYTRHNAGFLVIDNFVDKHQLEYKKKEDGWICETTISDNKIIIIRPMTYINNSGDFISEIMNYKKINPENLLVISDDINIPFGKLRIREKGSSGGHNGLKSIINKLNSQEFNRLRFGVGLNDKDVKKYVLDNFTPEEKEILNNKINISVNIIEDWIEKGSIYIMNKYNATT